MYAALLEKLEVVGRTLAFMYTDDFTDKAVNYD